MSSACLDRWLRTADVEDGVPSPCHPRRRSQHPRHRPGPSRGIATRRSAQHADRASNLVHCRRPTALNQSDELLLGVRWAAALRCSELLLALDVDDLTFSKPDETGSGDCSYGHGIRNLIRPPNRPPSPFRTRARSPRCPVRLALQHFRRVRSGALLRRGDRHGESGHRPAQQPKLYDSLGVVKRGDRKVHRV